MQLRRGTAARWTEVNPVLDAGQPGFESDTHRLKIGDGSTDWNALPYIGGGCGNVVEGSSASAGQTSLGLSFGTFAFGADEPGVPVVHAMRMEEVGASWLSTNPPAGPWTATLYKRSPGASSRVPVATFSVNTTNP